MMKGMVNEGKLPLDYPPPHIERLSKETSMTKKRSLVKRNPFHLKQKCQCSKRSQEAMDGCNSFRNFFILQFKK